MAAVSTDDLLASIVTGIENAHNDYEMMSGGEWIWTGAEYLLTTYIARAIHALPGTKYVTVEHNGKSALKDAGSTTPGPKPKHARLDGRFDLLVWWANGLPRGVVEVKNQLGGPSGWFHDIDRIAYVLRKRSTPSSIRFGAFAYYYSDIAGSRYDAKEKVERKFSSVEQLVQKKTKGLLRVRQHTSAIHEDGESAWGAACLLMQPCAQ